MKTYYLDTVFTFGKYEGETIAEIADFDPYYIEWCVLNLDYFFIDENTIEKLEHTYPNFSMSEEAREKLGIRHSESELNKPND